MTVEAIQSLLSDDKETELITKGEIYDVIHEDNFAISIISDQGEVILFEKKDDNVREYFKLYQDMADLVFDEDPGY